MVQWAYLGPWFQPAQLRGSDVGSVMQPLVLHTLSYKQEVEAALTAAKHLLPLRGRMRGRGGVRSWSR